jgi:hypothetical protein
LAGPTCAWTPGADEAGVLPAGPTLSKANSTTKDEPSTGGSMKLTANGRVSPGAIGRTGGAATALISRLPALS